MPVGYIAVCMGVSSVNSGREQVASIDIDPIGEPMDNWLTLSGKCGYLVLDSRFGVK